MKKIIFCLTVLLFSIGVIEVRADVLFEYRRQEVISRGVTYELVRQMTLGGMLDIHILYIDMTDPYLYIGPVANWAELGRRATTSAMLDRAGAIAGVNAAFFDMGSIFTNHFGPMISDGEIIALNNYTNSYRPGFSSIFIDNFNNVFFSYMTSFVTITREDDPLRMPLRMPRILQFNNIGSSLDYPALINRNGFDSTHEISRRISGLTYIVFEDNRVIYTSTRGVDVMVPYNGYVLLLPARWIHLHEQFQAGDAVEVTFSNNLGIDFSHIRSAVSGGAIILANGQIVPDTASRHPGRQPRSVVGVSACGDILILMVIDGRTHSIGASHTDTANLLLRFGAFNAMHFDGGGSATMAHIGSGSMTMVNRPADGAQRQVINALGVFDRSVRDEITEIVGLPWAIEASDDISFLSYPAGVTGSVARDIFPSAIVYRLNYRFFETNAAQAAHLAFSTRLPGNPIAVQMLVYGNNSGHWLRGRVRDANGITHNIDFVNSINFLGWHEVTALLPTDAPAPFTLERIYAAALSHGAAMSYNLSFTHLAALFAPTDHYIPPITIYSESYRVGPDFVGTNSIDIPVPTARQVYSTNIIGTTIIINISARGGGISAVDRNQWGYMTRDLNTFVSSNVIIVFDDNPKTAFNSVYEYELFHLAMTQQRDLGRNVFVVSATGYQTEFIVRDDIRYINLDSHSPYIRFWLEQNKILWSDL